MRTAPKTGRKINKLRIDDSIFPFFKIVKKLIKELKNQ